MWRFFFCIGLTLSLNAKPLAVEVKARSAILMNADTGAVLFEKNAHVPSFPASTTKVATALFILDHKKPALNQMITVAGEGLKMKDLKNMKEAPAYWLEKDGTTMWLLKGEVLSLETLLHGLLLISGNDAANTLAGALSASIPSFMEELNVYAKNLGCLNTQLLNPHGLHHPEHYTTAFDMAILMKKAVRLPKFRELASKISYLKPKSNKQPQSEIKSFYPLIQPGKSNYYAKAIAVKTGTHSAAGYNIVAAAEHEGRTLVAVAFGCANRADRNESAIRLFEAAFAEKKERRRLIGPESVMSQEIVGSKTPLRAALAKELAIEYFPAEDPNPKAFVHWEVPKLPIRKGQKVGEIQIITADGSLLQKGDLVSLEEVKGTLLFVLKETIQDIFR